PPLRLDEAVAPCKADGCDLRVGEGDTRDRPVVRLRLQPRDRARRDAPLVLADVREGGDSGDVADAPDALSGAEAFVDRHPPARELDAEELEADPLDVRPPAGRDEQALAVDDRSVLEVDADAALHAGHLRV